MYTISMAQEYEKQGNYPEALDVYEYLIATDPTDLILQEKVKELKQKVGREEKKIEEEKIEGLQLETYFRPEDLMKKEHIEPHQPQVSTSTESQKEPTEKTEILVARDDDYIYAAGRLYDSEPSRIQASSKKRDNFGAENDWFGVVIDSFNDMIIGEDMTLLVNYGT